MLILDPWYRYGQANARAKINTAGFACETLIIVFLTILANDVTRVCTSRSPFHVACADINCWICVPGYVNCVGLLKMHTAGLLAYELIRQLPCSNRQDILSDGNGLFFHTDINWTQFHRDDRPGTFMLD